MVSKGFGQDDFVCLGMSLAQLPGWEGQNSFCRSFCSPCVTMIRFFQEMLESRIAGLTETLDKRKVEIGLVTEAGCRGNQGEASLWERSCSCSARVGQEGWTFSIHLSIISRINLVQARRPGGGGGAWWGAIAPPPPMIVFKCRDVNTWYFVTSHTKKVG